MPLVYQIYDAVHREPGIKKTESLPQSKLFFVEESDMQIDIRKKMLEAKSKVMCSTETEEGVISSACEFRENTCRGSDT